MPSSRSLRPTSLRDVFRVGSLILGICCVLVVASAPAYAGIAFDIYGKLEFEAEYLSDTRIDTRIGEVPVGKSPLPYLRVCAFDRDGGDGHGVDFEYTDYALDDGNDDLLGCARADIEGNYRIAADWESSNQEAAPDIYLMTKLCDGAYQGTGASSPAEVCVRINGEATSFDRPENLKVIWSRRVRDADIGSDVLISWNLSCPNQRGHDLPSVDCVSVEPDNWDIPSGGECACDESLDWKLCVNQVDCSSGTCSDTNSRYGCNKEAVHLYRAGIESVRSYGTNRPKSSSTFFQGAVGCRWSSNDDFCDDPECQDELKLHLARVESAAGPIDPTHPDPDERNKGCQVAKTNNGARDFDDSCYGTPLNPFRVVHELGHNVDMRWKCDDSGHSGDGGDKKAIRQGFANFFSSAAWFPEDAAEPKYCGGRCWDVESGTEADGLHKNITRFFWDLHDDSTRSDEWDLEDWSVYTVRNILSAFLSDDPGGADAPIHLPGGSSENDPGSIGQNGVNALDYVYWWSEKRTLGPSFCSIVYDNYVDLHSDTMFEGDLEDICPVPEPGFGLGVLAGACLLGTAGRMRRRARRPQS